MIFIRVSDKKVQCAKCGSVLNKKDMVKDRFLPTICHVPTAKNYVGVCKDCHKKRLKLGIVLPTYWNFLNSVQLENLKCELKHSNKEASYNMSEMERQELYRYIYG